MDFMMIYAIKLYCNHLQSQNSWGLPVESYG